MVTRNLCFDDDFSPLSKTRDDDFVDVFFSSTCQWVEEDSRDSGYGSPTNQCFSPSPKKSCNKNNNTRRSLFSGKRLRDDDDVDVDVFPKHFRLGESASDDDVSIDISQKMEGEGHLTGDGSENHCLPTVCGDKPDLMSISPTTVTELIDGVYQDEISSFQIADCRYPYEFEGGHIKGAINLYTQKDVQTFLSTQSTQSENHILIFHCEFSSERAPKLLRYLRNEDRKLNSDVYPKLFFPEIYLLCGGYKQFFNEFQNYCSPVDYVPMLDKEHGEDLRHFRSRAKSWTAGQRRRRGLPLQQSGSPPLF